MKKALFATCVAVIGATMVAGILLNKDFEKVFEDLLKDLQNDIKF